MTKDDWIDGVLGRLVDYVECDEYHVDNENGETPCIEHKDYDEAKAKAEIKKRIQEACRDESKAYKTVFEVMESNKIDEVSVKSVLEIVSDRLSELGESVE